MTYVAIATLVVCLTLGRLVNDVLYAPWRVRRISGFLFVHSAAYRRWRIRRFTRGMNETIRAYGEALVPVVAKASMSLRRFAEALEAQRPALEQAEMTLRTLGRGPQPEPGSFSIDYGDRR